MSESDLRPLRNQILIKRDEPPSMTAGGLHLPEVAQPWRSNYATVRAVGPKCHSVKVGDRLVLTDLGGKEFRYEGELLAMIDETDDCLVGVLEPDAAQ